MKTGINRIKFAKVCWMAGDVQTLRPEWTLKKCSAWLSENEKYIQEDLVKQGWNIIASLLDP